MQCVTQSYCINASKKNKMNHHNVYVFKWIILISGMKLTILQSIVRCSNYDNNFFTMQMLFAN